jgi:hypothetical protein
MEGRDCDPVSITVILCLKGLSKIIKYLGHDAWHTKYELGNPNLTQGRHLTTGRSDVQRQMRISWLFATTPNALNYHPACRLYSERSFQMPYIRATTRHTSQTGDNGHHYKSYNGDWGAQISGDYTLYRGTQNLWQLRVQHTSYHLPDA